MQNNDQLHILYTFALILLGFWGVISPQQVTINASNSTSFSTNKYLLNGFINNENLYANASVNSEEDLFENSKNFNTSTQLTCIGGTLSGSDTLCIGSNNTLLSLTGYTGTIQKWQSASTIDFSNPIDIAVTADTYSIVNLENTTYYRVLVVDGNNECYSSTAQMVMKNGTSVYFGETVNNLPNGNTYNTKHNITASLNSANNVFVKDIDGDGDFDVLGSSSSGRGFLWWENNGNEVFTEHEINPYSIFISDVYASDIDNDGDIDLLYSAYFSETIFWYENDGNENFVLRTITEDFDGVSGIYTIDVDNDGDMDVVGSATNANEIAWWENALGNGNVWTKHIISADFLGATSVQCKDIDNDGDIDIIGTAKTSDEISWWENDGNQLFTKNILSNSFIGAIDSYCGDIDNDGDIDIIGAASISDEIIFWENDGNEIFSEVIISSNFDSVSSIFAIDLDGDSDLEIIGTAANSGELTWWENAGDQTFLENNITNTLLNAQSVFAADLDGDGDNDILSAAKDSHEISWWENVTLPAELISSNIDNEICDGELVSFSASGGTNYEFFLNGISVQTGVSEIWESSTLINQDTVCVLTSYLNGCQSKSVDFIITVYPTTEGGTISSDTTVCAAFNNVSLSLNNYTGEIIKWQSSNDANFSLATDISNSSSILTTNNLTQTTYYRAQIKSGICEPEYSSYATISVTTLEGLLVGDVEVCQGSNSSVLTLSGHTSSVLYWQSSDSEFFFNSNTITNTSNSLTVEDLNKTTFYRVVLDSGTCISTSNTVKINVNYTTSYSIGNSVNDLTNGLARNTKNILPEVYNSANAINSVDMDYDGDMDLLVTSKTYGKYVNWLENDGTGSFTNHEVVGGGFLTSEISAYDIDNDGDMDILTGSYTNDEISWWENDGSFGFTEHEIEPFYNSIKGLSAVDMDKDGDLDILAASYFDNVVNWWENDGNSVFTKKIIHNSFSRPSNVFAKDIDGDGNMDVVGSSYSANVITWWKNDGNENFYGYIVATGIENASDVHANDIDGDGDIDIIGADASGKLCWLENNGGQLFTKNTISSSFSDTYQIHTEDIDNDGDIDIISISDQEGIIWWENNGNEIFIDHEIDDNISLSYLNKVNLSDIDGDGDLDVVSSKFGIGKVTWWENVLLPASLECSSDTEYCSDTPSPTFISSGGTSYEFFLNDVSVQNGPINTWESSGLMGSDTIHVVVTTDNGCLATSVEYITQAFPISQGGSISSDTTVCSGLNNVILTLQSFEGSIMEWQSSTQADFSNPTSINNSSIEHSITNLTETTYYRVAVKNGPCDVVYSSTAIITVEDIAGEITGESVICLGDGTSLTLQGHTGTIVKWQSSSTPSFSNPIDIINSTNTLVVDDLISTTYFRALVDSGNCIAASDIFQIKTISGTQNIIGGTVSDQPNGGTRNLNTTLSTFFNGASSIEASDIDGDGDMDILATASVADDIAWWENDNNGFSKHTITTYFNGVEDASAKDLDNDGDIDIIAAALHNDEIAWWENNGNEVFTQQIITSDFDGVTDISVVDINKDGFFDILGAAQYDDQIAWWQNNGNQEFTKHIITNSFDSARGVNTIDIDEDGDLDIFGASYADGLFWWENNGNQEFTEHIISTDYGFVSVRFADIHEDGDLDIFGGNLVNDQIVWFENDLDGQYWTPNTISGSTNHAEEIVTRDFDGDGDIDILGGGTGSLNTSWWRNNGSGNFNKEEINIDQLNISGRKSFSAYDMDADDDLDILYADHSADDIGWLENVSPPADLQSSDFDNKICGNEEITFTSSEGTNYEFFLNRVSVQNGIDSFWSSTSMTDLDTVNVLVTYENGCLTSSVDHIIEVHPVTEGGNINGGTIVCPVSNSTTLNLVGHIGEIAMWQSSSTSDFSIYDIIANTTDTYLVENLTQTTYYRAVILSDLCGLEYSSIESIELDNSLAGGTMLGSTAVCYGENSASLTLVNYTGQVIKWQSSTKIGFTNPIDIYNSTDNYEAVDLNSTTYYRAIISFESCEYYSEIATIIIDEITGLIFDSSIENLVTSNISGPSNMFTIDFDFDGDIDVLSSSGSGDALILLENQGALGFETHIIDGYFDNASDIIAVDIDMDGDLDVVGTSLASGDVTWYENTGNFSFIENTIDSVFAGAISVDANDVDGDGDMDILAAGITADDITWWENDGNQNFTEHTIDSYFNGASWITSADLDADGDIDVLATALFADDITWWENDGNEFFTEHTILGYFNGANSVSAIDIDGDGLLDILGTANTAGEIRWWKNNGGNNFSSNIITDSIPAVSDAYASDLDKDGDMDIVASDEHGSVTWWQNDGDENFAEFNISNSLDNASSIAVADINNDGNLDILSTSFGQDKIVYWERTLAPVVLNSSSNDNIICNDESITFTSTGGSNYEFFINNISIQNGADSTFTSPILSDQDYIHVLLTTINGCQLSSEAIIVDVFQPAVGGSVTGGGTVCSGINSTSLSLMNYTGNIASWESSSTEDFNVGLEIFDTNSMIEIAGLTENRYYRALVSNPGCDTVYSEIDSIIVDQTVLGGIISGDAIVCIDINNSTLTVSGYSGTIQSWQSSINKDFSNPVTIINTQDSYQVSNISQTTYYRAIIDNNGCTAYSDSGVITIDLPTVLFIGSTIYDLENDLQRNLEHTLPNFYYRDHSVLDVVDLDSDGDMDILGSTTSSSVISWLRNDGIGGFTEIFVESSLNNINDIVTADMDEDGDIDILAARSNTDGFTWLINDGNQNFNETPISYDFSYAYNLNTGDIDNDGNIDVIGCSNYNDKISWWKNEQNGIFTEYIITESFDGATNVLLKDFDNDGDTDIIGSAGNSGEIAWWENDGNQNFTKHVISTNYQGYYEMTLVDLDEDGHVDILTEESNASRISWWKNDGSQNFTQIIIESNINGVRDPKAVDIDGDGDLDIFAAAIYNNAIKWWKNDGNENFTTYNVSESFSQARAVNFGDFNNDGILDVVGAANNTVVWWESAFLPAELQSNLTNYASCIGEEIIFSSSEGVNYEYFLNRVSVQNGTNNSWSTSNLNNQDTVHLVVTYPSGCTAQSIDLIPEVMTTTVGGEISGGATVCPGENNSTTLSLNNNVGDIVRWESSNTLDFITPLEITNNTNSYNAINVSETTYYRAFVDNGVCDSLYSSIDTIFIFDSFESGTLEGGTTFCETTNNTTLTLVGNDHAVQHWETSFSENFESPTIINNTSNTLSIVDLKRTSYYRVVTGNTNCLQYSESEEIIVQAATEIQISSTIADLPNGQERSTEYIIGDDFTSASSIDTKDIDNDGDIDVIGTDLGGDKVIWWENDGNQNFTEHIIASNYNGAADAIAVDLDGDGDQDVLSAANYDDDITWWENDGSQNFTEHIISSYFNGAISVDAKDIDGDGDIDVLAAANVADDIAWWENDGNQNFTQQTISSYFDGVTDVNATDIDGDGDIDILAAAYNADDITWWENNGNEGFTQRTIDSFFNGANSVSSIDLDNDGDMDIIGTAFYADDLTWWKNDGNQVFTEITIDANYNGAQNVVARDLDNDGDIDLVSSSSYEGDLHWWENDGNQNFNINTISQDLINTRSAHINDMDGDGDWDVLAIGNSNSKFYWWENVSKPVEIISSAENNEFCPGSPVSFTSSGGINYEFFLNGISVQNSSINTWTSTSLNHQDTVYVLMTAENGCTANSVQMIAEHYPQTEGGVVSGGSIVCPNTNSTNLLLTGHIGNVLNWESSTSFTFNDITIINSSDSMLVVNNLSQTIYYRALVGIENCSSAYSSVSAIEIDNSLIGGTINNSATVCANLNSTVLNLIGHSGNIVEWQSSHTSDFSTITSISNSTTSQLVEDIASTKYYRAVLSNGVCFRYSEIATITVNYAIGINIGTTIEDLPNGETRNTEYIIDENYTGITSITASDIDGDGDVDILGTSTGNNGTIDWWENQGNNNYEKHAIGNYFSGASDATPLDIDGDGDIDILGAAEYADDISWWENNGSQVFTERFIDIYFYGASSVLAKDLDGDGDIDFIGAANNDDEITWWENDGNESFSSHIISSFLGAHDLDVNDIDGDGDLDILGASFDNDLIAWWENDGNEIFTFHLVTESIDGPNTVIAVDIDGDQDIDFLSAATNADDLTWWENNGSEVFTENIIIGFYDGATSLYAEDMDGDGDLDLLSTASLYNEVTWWENNGNQEFNQITISEEMEGAISVFPADFDGDGDFDVLSGGDGISIDQIKWWENVQLPGDINSSAGDTPICSGDPVTFSSSGGTNYEFFHNGVSVQSSTSNTWTSSSLADQDTVYVNVIAENGCSTNSVIMITELYANPIGGIVSGSTEVCSTVNSTELTLSGNIGSVLNWQSSSSSNFLSVININTTDSTITIDNLTETTFYRAVVQSDNCSFTFSSFASIIVDDTDADLDGVCDLLDQCLGTEAGVPVDEFGCPLSCQDIITISNNILSDTFQAEQIIISDGLILSPGPVEFRAGNEISLEIGFETELGTDFHAFIQGCNVGTLEEGEIEISTLEEDEIPVSLKNK